MPLPVGQIHGDKTKQKLLITVARVRVQWLQTVNAEYLAAHARVQLVSGRHWSIVELEGKVDPPAGQ